MNVLNAKDTGAIEDSFKLNGEETERDMSDYHGIRSPEDAKRIGLENNYGSPKGVAFDIAM